MPLFIADEGRQQKLASKKSNNFGNQWVNEVYSFLVGFFKNTLDLPNDYNHAFVDAPVTSSADTDKVDAKCREKLGQSAVVHLTFGNKDIVEKRKELRMTFTAGLANLGNIPGLSIYTY